MGKNSAQSSRKQTKSFAEQKNLKKKSFFQAPLEDAVVLRHEEIDVMKSFADMKNDENNNLMQNIEFAKEDMIMQRRDTVVNERRSTNIQVIMAITNTLIGSVVLCLPYNWLNGGFISSLIIMLFMGAIQYYTCSIYVQNQLPGDTDGAQIIERLLGSKYSKLFQIMSALLLFVAGIVYFMLQNQVLYAFIKFIFAYADGETQLPPINEIHFNSFSVQYQCIALAVPVFFMISMKELSVIIKLGQYGVLAVIAYGGYMTFLFIKNLCSSEFTIHWKEVHMFPEDFSQVILVMGNFGLAFFLHNGITTILANAENQKKNTSNLMFGYINVLAIYGLVGILGSIGILDLDWQQPGIQTVSQLFNVKDIMPAIVNVLFLFQLSTALPILCFISRSQIFALIFNGDLSYPHKYNIMFNLIFMGSAVVMQILAINPNILIGLDGAICGFYMVYMIPFGMRLKSYGKKLPSNFDLRKSSAQLNTLIQKEDQEINTGNSLLDNNTSESLISRTKSQSQNKIDLQAYYADFQKLPLYEYIIWGGMILVGVIGAFLQIYGIIISMKDTDSTD